jgi:hypothetical protein
MDEMSPSELRLRALELAAHIYESFPGDEGVIQIARKFYNFIKPTNAEMDDAMDVLEEVAQRLHDAIHDDEDQATGAVN